MSFTFGTPKTTTSTGFTFGTPTTTAPLLGQSFGAGDAANKPATGISFGSTAATNPLGGLGSTPIAGTGFSLGGATAAAPASTGFNLGGTLTGFGSPKTTATQPAPTGFSAFGTPKTTASTGFSLLGSTPTQLGSAGTTPASLAPVTNATPTGFSLGTPVASTASTLTTGFSLGTPATSTTSSTAATTTATGFSLGGTSSLSITKTTSATPAPLAGFSLTSTAQPGALNIPTPASTAASVPASLAATTVTTSSSAAPVVSTNFGQLEESINKWTLELEEQEKVFMNQATQVNAWDRMLIENGDKIVTLNESVEQIKQEQKALEHELDFIVSQQVELEEMISPLEKELANVNIRDPEREMTYQLAENLDTQFKQMAEDLKEVIEHLNETNRSQDSSDPIVQIGRILNAHMSSLQWVDSSTSQISSRLQQINKMQETLRRNTERAFTFE